MTDNPTPNEGASEGKGGNRRRRRRGNRRPEDRPTSTESSTDSPRPQPVAKPTASGDAASTSTPSDSDGGGERRSRNRRRKKKGPRPEGAPVGSDAETDSEDSGADDAVSSAPSTPQPRPERPERQDRPERQERRRDGNRDKRRDQPQKDAAQPQEKKERAPRGSVLQRRSTRGGVDLDAALAKDQPEEASAPMPIATDVDTYIKQLKGWQREVVTTLRGIVRNQARDAEEGIMWSQPVYTLNGPVCYIKAFSDHVNFGFWRGNEIDDPEDLLTGELPTMRHVTIRHVNDVKRDAFEALVRSAVKLNREKGDPT